MNDPIKSAGFALMTAIILSLSYMMGIPGLLLGCMISFFLSRKINVRHNQQGNRFHRMFFDITFKVMGHLAKADGQVSAHSIEASNAIMDNMNLSSKARAQGIHCFRRGKARHFNLAYHLKLLKLVCKNNPHLASLFMEIQCDLAYADGPNISVARQRILAQLAHALGLQAHASSRYQRPHASEEQAWHRTHKPGNTYTRPPEDDYSILGVKPSESLTDIRKAYRRLISQHHPDRMIAKKASPELIRQATEQTQRIKASFERIEKKHPSL
jgi:DnaJ like chaperone protein